MISLDLLRADPGLIRSTVRQRGMDVPVDRLLQVDDELRQAVTRSGAARAALRRHAMSRERGDVSVTQTLQDELAAVTEQVRTLQQQRDELWGRLPNLLAPDTPAEGAVELRRAGAPPAAEEARRYDAVGAALGILTPGAADSPWGCPLWRGAGARLVWAVLTHAQQVLHARGCTPLLLSADQPLIGYHRDQILDAAALPIRLCGFTPGSCADTGDHRVEQVVLCRAEDAARWVEDCLRVAEDLLGELELPYRVVRVGAEELDAAAYEAYAIECWFPGSGAYRQTHTISHCSDYLARRYTIRYLERGRVSQPHTVSATAATDRAVLAVLENHRQPDGSVRIPTALRPYLDGQALIEPPPSS